MAVRRSGDGRLPTTHWSLVARAGFTDNEARRDALGELLTRYLPALRAHLIHSKRLTDDEADDVLQEKAVPNHASFGERLGQELPPGHLLIQEHVSAGFGYLFAFRGPGRGRAPPPDERGASAARDDFEIEG